MEVVTAPILIKNKIGRARALEDLKAPLIEFADRRQNPRRMGLGRCEGAPILGRSCGLSLKSSRQKFEERRP